MDTCPMCSCLITDDICVMCGYKLKKTNKQYEKNSSVFDIFDFIDGKDSSNNKNTNTHYNIDTLNKIKNKNYIPNKNNSYEKNTYEKNTYEKNTYSQVKYDKNYTQLSLENNNHTTNIDTSSQVSHSKPKNIFNNKIKSKNIFNNKTKPKNIFNFFIIIAILLLLLLQPSLVIFIFILRGAIYGTNKDRNKR